MGLALLLVAGACSEDLPPQSLVDKFRVLGVRADLPEAAPGETVRVDALLADPLGEGRAVSYLWAACLLGPAANPDDCMDPEAGGILGLGFTPEFSFVAPALPEGDPSAQVLVILLACAGGTFVLPTVDGGDPSGFPECEGGDGATVYKRVTVRETDTPNHNPMFLDVAVDGTPFGLEPVELPACAEGECGERTVTAAVAPDAVETFIEIAFGEPVEREEGVYVSWFATAGSFERIRSGVDNLEVGWTPPAGPATVDLWFVLHDGRGGTDWRGARLVLVED
ncbi:MAG: hypothetical protein JXB32_04315 [Deltaproteobacteria bacterium]|nr:hypothetical protein [Deltaproteobacteria bacterium]